MSPADPRDSPLRVTAIVTCHNHAKFLGYALRSIIAQTSCGTGVEGQFSIDQIVVVDDGSDDEPVSVVRDIDPGITVLRHPRRRGIAAARNLGWRCARTEAIAFLDADDVWPPRSLAVRAHAMQADPTVSVVFGRAQIFAGDEVGRAEIVRLPGTMLIRTTEGDRVGAFDEALTVGETVDWVARAADIGLRFIGVDETVLLRRRHSANSTRDRAAVQRDLMRVVRAAHARRS